MLERGNDESTPRLDLFAPDRENDGVIGVRHLHKQGAYRHIHTRLVHPEGLAPV
jgi:hypothetical protein